MTPFSELVDPFIGTDGPGNCLCGPYLPHGIVRLGPDTLPPQPTSGYRSDKPIVCFSHTHVSGTGGGGRYGNIGVMPFLGPPRFAIDASEHSHELAEPGYYRTTLEPSGILVELTVSPRAGCHRYTFPEDDAANILIDVGAVIQVQSGDKKSPGWGTGASIGGFLEWISETQLMGRGDFRGGWGHAFPYSIHFFGMLDRAPDIRKVGNASGTHAGTSCDGPHCKALARFKRGGVVTLQIGISHISVANARAHVETAIGAKTFDDTKVAARTTWEEALSRIRVEGGSQEQRKLFYTLFTRLLCMPGDLGIDDEFPSWRSGVRHFTDYYCLWDSVRNANSLISLFDPELEVAMLNCLLDIADHTGWLPDAWIAGHSAQVQGGSSADILFCEAALKALPGIDYTKALRQIRKNAEVPSSDPRLHGRHIEDFNELGYVSTAVPQCVSRHLEYAYQDWCIGALADKLGERETAIRYSNNSRKLWNLWREDLKCFAPKDRGGNWAEPFDPARCKPDSWNDPFCYEGTARQWSFNAHHDFAGLVARHGGPEAFVAHLDAFFDKAASRHDRWFDDCQVWDFYDSKETMLHIPYLYLYAGRPDKTAERVRWAMATHFRPSRNGLSDNEDMGSQSAFYMCSALGIYPVMGQDIYWLTTPTFVKSVIALGKSGNRLVIEAPRADEGWLYVQSAMWNGESLDRAWLRHADMAQGGTLTFQLSLRPTNWGCSQPPPSPMANNES